MDPYEVLGIAKDASRWHVEKAKESKEAAAINDPGSRSDDCNLAYFILSSSDRRAAYDTAEDKEQSLRLLDAEYRKEQAAIQLPSPRFPQGMMRQKRHLSSKAMVLPPEM